VTQAHHQLDALFQQAVRSIDIGDAKALRGLLDAHPTLACVRLDRPGAWLRNLVGDALEGFFARPYLLWFIAEDPVRQNRLPQNIVELAQIVIAAGRRHCTTIKEQVDYALQLVAWSWVAAREGVQIPLLDTLLDAGANCVGSPENALVNGHLEAAAHLIRRGAPLSLASAALLGQWSAFEGLAESASRADMQFGLTLAALRGNAEAVRRLIRIGADPNTMSLDLYSHGFPLHHAVSSGSLDAVQALVDAGARLDALDTLHEGTPRGWAEYMSNREPRYVEIARYLHCREAEANGERPG